MRIRQNIALFFMLFGAVATAHAQQDRTEFSVNFPIGSAVIEPAFASNARQISGLTEFLEGVNRDEAVEITGITLRGTASLEGSWQLNRNLAQKRIAAMEQAVRSKVTVADELITRDDCYIRWDDLRQWIAGSEMLQKQAALDIIDSTPKMVRYAGGATIDNRVLKLKELDNGRVWEQLSRDCFGKMREACVVIVTFRKEMPKPAEVAEPAPAPVEEPAPAPVATVIEEPAAEPAPAKPFIPRMHLKTNVVGWGLGIANLAVEFDLCRHLSFALPIYYSGWDYFTNDIKFRTFAFQPELRCWFADRNDGWFVGGHFGAGWYNLAARTKYRYQDHDRETPALGGGVSVGYRLPIGRSNRWRVEFAVGGGAYKLHYDGFRNEPNGKLAGSKKTTYIGLDNVSVAFGYTFDMKKGGSK